MHTICLSLEFCDSRLFCTAVMMRDKLVKASFPASLGKALAVRTHHRSRSQELMCCKLKPETFQLKVCLLRSTCCDRRNEMEKAPAAICLGQFPHVYKYPRLAQQRLLNFSTGARRWFDMYIVLHSPFISVWVVILILIRIFFQTKQNVL